MATKPKTLLRTLSRRGPHTVLRGDLAFVGMPGLVLTPQAGMNLPAVAFGHHWMTDPERYLETFAHLASWGFVVAAPATERGPVPSARGLAADLGTALDVATGVRLGRGEISVHPRKLALAGHGFGAGAALLTAADRPVAAVAALMPADTEPPAAGSAARVYAPTLVVSEAGTGGDPATATARAIVAALPGDPITRTVPGTTAAGPAETGRAAALVGFGAGDRGARRRLRGLLTGFLLATAAGDDDYAAFADPDADLPDIGTIPAAAPPPPHPAALLLGR